MRTSRRWRRERRKWIRCRITSLRIRWLAPTNTGPPITDYDYRYRIKTPQGEWATFENTPITVLEQVITDLQENTEYQVQVRGNNEEGEGAWSESGEGETEANAAPHFTSSDAFEIAENSTAAVGGGDRGRHRHRG